MPTVQYRELGLSELRVAQDLRAAMIREMNGTDPDVTHPGWRDRYEKFYEQQIGADRAALFVADDGFQAVGVAAVYLLRNHRSEIFGYQSAYVSNVWVEPEHRRQGIASELMRRTIDWARAKGCEVVRLRSSAMAKPVYASLGFTPTDEMELRFDRQ